MRRIDRARGRPFLIRGNSVFKNYYEDLSKNNSVILSDIRGIWGLKLEATGLATWRLCICRRMGGIHCRKTPLSAPR